MMSNSILVPRVVFVSVPFTELHVHAYIYCIAFVVVRMCIVYQQSTRFTHSLVLLSFVRVSLSISELHECASSHCCLLWYEKAIVYQTSYQNIGVIIRI